MKWRMHGIWRPCPSPRFTRLPVTSTLQPLLLLAQRKNEILFAKRPIFPFDKCSTTTLFLINATAYLSSLFSGSSQVLRNSLFFGSHIGIFYLLSKNWEIVQSYANQDGRIVHEHFSEAKKQTAIHDFLKKVHVCCMNIEHETVHKIF